jgi:hypothetical protein
MAHENYGLCDLGILNIIPLLQLWLCNVAALSRDHDASVDIALHDSFSVHSERRLECLRLAIQVVSRRIVFHHGCVTAGFRACVQKSPSG